MAIISTAISPEAILFVGVGGPNRRRRDADNDGVGCDLRRDVFSL
jgi:hypothetical protein